LVRFVQPERWEFFHDGTYIADFILLELYNLDSIKFCIRLSSSIEILRLYFHVLERLRSETVDRGRALSFSKGIFLAVRQDVLPVRFGEFMATGKRQAAFEMHPNRHSGERGGATYLSCFEYFIPGEFAQGLWGDKIRVFRSDECQHLRTLRFLLDSKGVPSFRCRPPGDKDDLLLILQRPVEILCQIAEFPASTNQFAI
jgi:hypothetical protein